MKAQYFLPCSCGRETVVETSQAGQTVRCTCGADLEVPTLMQMSSLRRAEQERPIAPASRWGLRQRLMLIGALIALPALVAAAYLFSNLPAQEQVVPTYAPLDSLTIGETWQIWQDLRSGVERRPYPVEEYYAKWAQRTRQWIGVALVFFGVGMVVMIGSLFVPKTGRRRPTPNPPPQG